jgi:hypothetical protein
LEEAIDLSRNRQILEHATYGSAGSTVMKKWRWLLVNGCECESDFYRDGTLKLVARWDKCISVLGARWKNDDASLEYMSYI